MLWLGLLAGCAATSVDSDADSDAPADEVVCIDAWQTVPDAAETSVASGLRYCFHPDDPAYGKFDRVSAESCRPDAVDVFACPVSVDGAACAMDSDCGGGDRCLVDPDWNACECVPTCATDADCSGGEMCVCSSKVSMPDGQARYLGVRNECLPAMCRTSADCGGSDCGVEVVVCYSYGEVEEVVQAACRTPDDACALHSDCDVENGVGCVLDEVWTCDGTGIDCL